MVMSELMPVTFDVRKIGSRLPRRKKKNRYSEDGDGKVRVHLYGGEYALIDAADKPLVEPYTWHGTKSADGKVYARSYATNGKRVLMHRLILGLSNPQDGIGDHANAGSALKVCCWHDSLCTCFGIGGPNRRTTGAKQSTGLGLTFGISA